METNETKKPFNIYCNGIELSVSPYDFSFVLNNNSIFGQELLGEIKMSPEHAKTFANILIQHVHQYEEMFGVIPQLDPEKMASFKEQGIIKVEESR